MKRGPKKDKLPPNLILRGSVYYFRLVVPEPLRKLLRRSEFQKSLETPDLETAVCRAAIEREKARALIANARAKVESGSRSRTVSPAKEAETLSKPSEPLRVTSDQHAARLAQQWFLVIEKEGARWWRESRYRLSENEREELLADLWFQEQDILGGEFASPPSCRYDGMPEVDSFGEHHRLTIKRGSEDFRLLAPFLIEARLEFIRRQRDRLSGTEVKTYSLIFKALDETTPMLAIQGGMTMEELVSRYISENTEAKKAPKTIKSYERIGGLLIDLFGKHRGIESVTREDVLAFGETIEAMPPHRRKRYPGMSLKEAVLAAEKNGDTGRLQPSTLQGLFYDAFSMFEYAVSTKQIPANPFDDELFKQRFTVKEDSEQRPPFTIDELQAIFRAPLYTGCLDDQRNYAKPGPNVFRRGRFWVPLIALFHGMRENEICQLHTVNIGEWEGGLFFDIRTGDDRSLKNKPSRRQVPVHPELLKFGFKEYVMARRLDVDSPRLFPDLKRASTGSYSDNFSKWFSNFLKKVFGTKIEPTFHSFRHNFTSACRVANLSPQRIDSLCGWAGGGRQQRGYGVAAPVPVLAEDLKRVSFSGLDLSHLYVPQVQEIALTAPARPRMRNRTVSP